MPARNPVKLFGARPLDDLFGMIEIFEDVLRCAERLLEDIVNADQPLHRLQQQHQRDDERSEIRRREKRYS